MKSICINTSTNDTNKTIVFRDMSCVPSSDRGSGAVNKTEVYHNSMPPKTEVSVVYPHRASTADHHT